MPNYASKATSESHTEKPATLKHKAGDIVKFTGSTHYKSSDASSGVSCKAGTAKITAVFEKGKHPYHLIAEKGGGFDLGDYKLYIEPDDVDISKIKRSNF